MPTTPPPCIDCRTQGITTHRKIAVAPNGQPRPGKRCAAHWRQHRDKNRARARTKNLEATYGLTEDQYQQQLTAQDGRCYVCGKKPGAKRRLTVDHDHDTGMVRGLLCTQCNRIVIGRYDQAALQRALDYRLNPPTTTLPGGIGAHYVPGTTLTGPATEPATHTVGLRAPDGTPMTPTPCTECGGTGNTHPPEPQPADTPTAQLRFDPGTECATCGGLGVLL